MEGLFKERILYATVIVTLVVVACGPTPAPVPAATPVPSATPAPSPSEGPKASPTEPPTPTATPIPPTVTPLPPTPTPLPATDTVCVAGCDFITIQAALDDAGTTDGAIIEVSDPVHTEAGIVVNKDVTIRGLGATNTIVQAHQEAGSAPDRVFLVEKDTSATIEGMTIRHGKPSVQEDDGGAIRNWGTLTVKDCVITANGADGGGGIGSSGDLTIIGSTVSNNTAYGKGPLGSRLACGAGGGIKCGSGTMTIINSAVHGNQAGSKNRGAGGGVNVGCGCTATLTNSTISGNNAVRFGGGIQSRGALQLANCTVSNNNADEGGGVYIGPGGTLDYENTIIAYNTGSKGNCFLSGPADQRSRATIGTNSNNLVEDDSCSPDYTGDPLLAPLADNGGGSMTHALLPGSPAVDAIPASTCALPTDQRSMPRPIVQTSADTPCDIGAYELQAEAESSSPQPTQPSIDLISPAFEPGGMIPDRHARFGKDVSPPLEWSEPPEGTQSFALLFVCGPLPDGGGDWIQWVLYNIPAETRALSESITPDDAGLMPDGSQHLANSWGELRYGGPNPAHFSTQRCTFSIYALGTMLDLDTAAGEGESEVWIGASREILAQAMEGHILAQGELKAKCKGK